MYKRFQESDAVSASRPGIREDLRVLSNHDELLLIGLILEDPSLYLSELQHRLEQVAGVQVSASTVCRVLRRNGLTRKKIQQVAKQRCTEYRGKYMAEVQLHNRD